uniref:Candidate secreted effector n=1 Tax=Meloidogyne incognita TaxID=6306 RepID=A0A914M0S0_MELIC
MENIKITIAQIINRQTHSFVFSSSHKSSLIQTVEIKSAAITEVSFLGSSSTSFRDSGK